MNIFEFSPRQLAHVFQYTDFFTYNRRRAFRSNGMMLTANGCRLMANAFTFLSNVLTLTANGYVNASNVYKKIFKRVTNGWLTVSPV